ncbi:hypothetical protein CY34DRAFT_16352 [Suillus luteus UH-Slu-Lm8-n1]|uniref:Uncharacterized protein n=1 Tax=Suillus luteus UH-Slu-Lm8-n1 TaxID=930992 RepID=A0A0D0AXA7_9AGAM|nr:hypothetical protein CY34DRAFT_16352 [Suillus luteus UH-Slu-Lm8-n1]
MILGVFDCGTNRPLIRLRAERRPSRRKPDERKKSESPPWWSDHMISPSDDTISRLQKTFKADKYDHLATLNLGSPSLRKLSFPAACEIFDQVEKHSWFYTLLRRQCYWFCTTFIMRVELKTGVFKIAGRESKRQGTPGYGYILGGRWKVLKEDKARRDIQKRDASQKDKAKQREDDDREKMKTKMLDALQRSEQERVAELEITRQAVQPLLITTQARQEADVLALKSTFSQIIAQPYPT